ncbi:MAG TPA: hypothetical protein VKZ99_04075 [Gammaproteobacteria bacterium]|nr:hypothetical protein [Gammaproteobacteria bacterium]
MSDVKNQRDPIYDDAAREAVNIANRLAEQDPDADLWDIADGLLAGAVHWWLYANAPCGDRSCVDCESVQTAELRLKELQRLVRELAEASEYFHSPNDTNVAHA